MELHVGLRLVYLRSNVGKTQAKVAKKLEVSRPTLTNWENGTHPIPPKRWGFLADFFKVSTGYFKPRQNQEENSHRFETVFRHLLFEEFEKIPSLLPAKVTDELSVEEEFCERLLRYVYCLKTSRFQESEEDQQFVETVLKMVPLELLKYPLSAYCRFYQCTLAESNNQFREAFEAYGGLLEYLDDEQQKNKVRIAMAKAALLNHSYVDALKFLNDALASLERNTDFYLLASCHSHFSATYFKMTLYNEASRHLVLLEEVAKTHQFPNFLLIANQQKGYIHSKKKQFPEALSCYQEALSYLQKTDHFVPLHISLVSASIQVGDFGQARRYIQAVKDRNLREHDEMVLLSFNVQMELFEHLPNSLTESASQVLDYFESGPYPHDLFYVYDYLASYFAKVKKYKESYNFLRKKESLVYA